MARSKTDNFRVWDGEGADIDGEHRYILMMAYDGERPIHMQDTMGISTEAAFEFLFRTAVGESSTANVIFSGGYDVNMILRDVPLPLLKELSDTNECDWEGWHIKYIPRKLFSLKKKSRSMTLFDCWGFFTGSLLSAIDGVLKGYDESEMEKIRKGKEKRGEFTSQDLPYLREYCLSELKATREMMMLLLDATQKLGLNITSWHGATAISTAMLNDKGVKRHMHDWGIDHGPEYRKATRTAFAGGRIELFQPGDHHGPIYHYDINSAYPAAMVDLPSLVYRCAFVPCNDSGCRIFDHDLCRVVADFIDEDIPDVYPLFRRTAHNGIVFPSQVDGWYWGPEVKLVMELFPNSVEIKEHYHFRTANKINPFGFVAQAYKDRQKYKAEGSHIQMALKLGLNSMYGKTAQKLGWKASKAAGTTTYEELSESRAIPPFHQLEWAGMITSATRAKLYRAAYQNLDAIIAIETDGIYTSEPLDLPLSTDLGDWDYQVHDRLTYVQSGFYFLEDAGEIHEKYRGLPKKSVTREAVLEAWESDDPKLTVEKVQRFPTLKESVLNDSSMKRWRSWAEFPKEVLVKAPLTKRKVLDPEMVRNGSFSRSVPIDDGEIMSYPRLLPWDSYGCPPDMVDDEDLEWKNNYVYDPDVIDSNQLRLDF